MDHRFRDIFQSITSPIPAAVNLLRHLFVTPSTLLLAPLSRPVLQRLRWIQPDLEDPHESYLYFNNMIDHGGSGPIHQLRLDMIHAGASSWQVCKPEEVEYKVDEKTIESDGLCEIFARVTVWKIRDQAIVDRKDKLGLILKLEVKEEKEDEDEDEDTEDVEEPGCDSSSESRLSWKYFDLQDLIHPGLDSRPWFSSIESARQGTQRQSRAEGSSSDGQKDYWEGYESSTEGCSVRSGSKEDGLIDPVLRARIQNTPLYRAKAPSVSSSTNSLDQPTLLDGSPHPGPRDLLARLSRTPLYKRAPSVEEELLGARPAGPAGPSALDQLMQAAEIVNVAAPSGGGREPAPSRARPAQPMSIHEIEQHLLDSLRATFNLYRLSLDLLHHQPDSPPRGPLPFGPGERFVAAAHRVVLNHPHSSHP